MRARPLSEQETQFLAGVVAGSGLGVTYADLQRAPAVLLAGIEPQDESPIVFLRLRKAVRSGSTAVYSVAALASPGLDRMAGTLLPTVPGGEAEALRTLADAQPANSAGTSLSQERQQGAHAALAERLRQAGSVILVGERLAEVPDALRAAVALAQQTGARLAWIPRRAGERGAIDAGALPVLLPGGRLVTDAAARAEVARAWGVASLPAEPGRDTGQILEAAWSGELEALVVAGVDPADLPDPVGALEAIERAGFVVSLELRASSVTDRADVVFPVAAVAEKAGTFVNWEGRSGEFGAALAVPAVRSDLEVLSAVADAMDIHLGLPDAAAARRELAALGSGPARSRHDQSAIGPVPARSRSGGVPDAAEALLATWHNLLDVGRMQDGEPHLAGTARPAVAKISAATAAEVGVIDGAMVSVATNRGAIRVPAEVTDMPDRVVWLPTNSAGCEVRRDLGAGHGSLVTVSASREDLMAVPPGGLAKGDDRREPSGGRSAE